MLRPPSGMPFRKGPLSSDKYAHTTTTFRNVLPNVPTNPGKHGWAYVSSGRHVSLPDLSSGSVCAAHVLCHVFSPDLSSACPRATPHVFAGPVFGKRLCHVSFAGSVLAKCVRLPTCYAKCLRQASSLAYVLRHVSLPDLVFACPCVFAPVGAGPTWLHCAEHAGQRSALRQGLWTPTCLRSDKYLRPDCVFKRPRVFAAFAWHVSADAQVSSQTFLGSLSPKPQVSSKCVFGLRAICASPRRPQCTKATPNLLTFGSVAETCTLALHSPVAEVSELP